MTSEPTSIDKAAQSGDETTHIRGSFTLLVGRVFAIVMALLFQVVITRYLPPSEFGLFAYGLSLATLVQSLASLGQEQSISRFLVLFDEEKQPARVFGTVVLYVATVLIAGSVTLAFVLFGLGDLTDTLGHQRATAVVATMVFLAPLESLDRLMEAAFAVAGRTRTIFVRKYVVNPLLKLLVAVGVVAFEAPVTTLAIGTVLAALAGLALYATQVSSLRERFGLAPIPRPVVPAREVLGFSVPLLTNELVIVAVMSGTVAIMGWIGTSTDVAEYRVIWPAARLNLVVLFTFSVLFLPSITRLYARKVTEELHREYWRTASWLAVLSLPIYLLTGPFSESTTVLLFGEQYRDSGWVLAVLSSAIYLGVVFGFSQHTLQIHARIARVVTTNVVITAGHLVAVTVAISEYGPRGAAVVGAIALVARIVANHRGLVLHTPVRAYEAAYRGLHATLLGAILTCWLLRLLPLPALADIAIAGLVGLAVLRANRHTLEVAATFPELARLPIVGRLAR